VDLIFACGAYASYAGDFSRLLQLAEQGRKVAEARFADESGEMQTFSTWRGTALVGLGRLDEALKELDSAVLSRERTQSGIYLAGSLLQRSWCYERMGRWLEALADAERASVLLLTRPDNPRLIAGQATYARLLAQVGRAEAAAAALAAIPAALLQQVPKGHRHWASYHRAEARIATANAEPEKAQAAAAHAERVLAVAFGPEHLWTEEARGDTLRPAATANKP
jgi:tetratricopeptide (TPR) repeat protein